MKRILITAAVLAAVLTFAQNLEPNEQPPPFDEGAGGISPVIWPVTVVNFPDPQQVVGTVDVGNLPASQEVTGTVTVGNFPQVQQVEVVDLGVSVEEHLILDPASACFAPSSYWVVRDVPSGGPWKRVVIASQQSGAATPGIVWVSTAAPPPPGANACLPNGTIRSIRAPECLGDANCTAFIPVGDQIAFGFDEAGYVYLRWER